MIACSRIAKYFFLNSHHTLFYFSILIFIMTISFIPPAFADEKPSLAILDVTPIKTDSAKALIAYNFILDKVNKSGSYVIVERKDIDRALKEIEFSRSMLVDNKTAIDIGKFTGARFVLISSLSLEEGTYYLSMRVIETKTGKVSETSMKGISDFSKLENLVTESVRNLLSVQSVSKEGEKKPSAPMVMYSTIGVALGMPIPIGNAGVFLNFTFEPCVLYSLYFKFEWGTISLGAGAGFDYFGVAGMPESWVMNFPVYIKSDYIFELGSFDLFTGLKAGIAISAYKAATISTAKVGIVPLVSPEIGMGFQLTRRLDIRAVAGFDVLIFGNGDIQMNINPTIAADLKL
jgi:hypothetical protein